MIKFLQHGLVEAFADPVSLWMACLRLRVLDVVDRQVELEVMALSLAAVFRASVGQNAQYRKLLDNVNYLSHI